MDGQYSADHMDRLVQYCEACNKPWLLLLPDYVHRKAYYQRLLRNTPQAAQPLYVVPNKTYTYLTPP